MIDENEVTLKVNAISNNCWKGRNKINVFFELHYCKEDLGDQININNCKNIFENVFYFTRAVMIIKFISR